ncbi:MAG: DUF2628 domain-containing protein [Aureispira sp.]|nr:DUF2628 domain-containing protein [Aureispira sp.]
MEILDDYIIAEELSEKEIDWQLFIGKEFEYYRPIWNKIEAGDKVPFNVYAFFFWVGWAGYRKMYQVYFSLLLVKILVDYIPYFLNFSEPAISAISVLFILVYLAWGFYANKVYYNHATKKIAQIKSTGLSKVLEQKSIRDAGQTDITFPIGTGVLLFVLLMLLNSFLGLI